MLLLTKCNVKNMKLDLKKRERMRLFYNILFLIYYI